MYPTKEACFLYRRQSVQERLLIDAVTFIGIDGKVTDSKRSQVLEEVRTLAWIDPIVRQASLNNDPGCRDVLKYKSGYGSLYPIL